MLTLLSPAKINLFLQILRKRSDGYHEIASLFQAISLADILHFELTDKDSLSCTDSSIPSDASNLIWKATNLFRQKTNLKFYLNIHVEKNIPTQAGLGGGSSNAATTLWALNKLLNVNLTVETLMSWAREIGSDIPFFLSNGTAYCTGRGEIIKLMPPLPQQKVIIIKPPFGLSTPAVYSHFDSSQLISRDLHQILANFYKGQPFYFNDLEKPAFEIRPELISIKDSLIQSGFTTVLLSGSGSCFFCLGQSKTILNNQYEALLINRDSFDWYQNK